MCVGVQNVGVIPERAIEWVHWDRAEDQIEMHSNVSGYGNRVAHYVLVHVSIILFALFALYSNVKINFRRRKQELNSTKRVTPFLSSQVYFPSKQ